METYNPDFYNSYRAASHLSGLLYLGKVFEGYRPSSILDIGCGVGTWLSAAKELGVSDILGVDGDYVNRQELEIEPSLFRAHDLTTPLDLGREFDLAISMEVGEHLPTEKSDTLVETLTRHAKVIVMSAAVPHQGGTDHINEQWPDFWAAKFAKRGYRVIDWARPQLWNESRIDYYYVQNGLLYVHESLMDSLPQLASAAIPPDHWSLRTIHPTKWAEANDPRRATFRFAGPAFLHAFPSALRRRAAKLVGRGF